MGTIRKKLDKAAGIVTKATGAKNLATYAGESLARRKNKNIKRTVTGQQARKSGIALAANVASLASGGAAGGVVRAASNARKVYKMKRQVAIAKGLKEGSLVRIKGQKKLMRVGKLGANPSSLKHLKGDRKIK